MIKSLPFIVILIALTSSSFIEKKLANVDDGPTGKY